MPAPERLPAPFLPDWLAAQVPFDRYVIELSDGMRAHVMEQGEGRPILLFHGNPTWGYLYRKIAQELAGEPLRLIMPDLMGLGFSDRVPVDRFTLRDHIGWMSELIEHLDLDDVLAVVQDWGGPIGLGALAQHDNLMTGLVVCNTVIGPPKPGFRPTWFHRVFGNPLIGGIAGWLGLVEKNMARAQADPDSISGTVRDSYLYPLRQHGNDAVIDLVRMVPDTMEHPSVAPLRDVGDFAESYDGPAAVVWGKRDPVLGRLLRRVSRALPQAEVTVTEAGHFLQEEVPAEIADAIRYVASS